MAADFQAVALDFAQRLSSGDFEGAASLLAAPLKKTLGAKGLAAAFGDEIAMYEEGFQPASRVTVRTMTDWPDKQPQDAGWAYAGIIGEFARGAWVTGVTVIVAKEGKKLLIRDIEWGRP